MLQVFKRASSPGRGGETSVCAETFSASMKLLNLKCLCAFVFFLNIKLIKLLNEAGSCNCRVESKSMFIHSHYPVMAVTVFSTFLSFFLSFYLSLFSFNLYHQCPFKIRPKGGLRTQLTDSSGFVSHWQAPHVTLSFSNFFLPVLHARPLFSLSTQNAFLHPPSPGAQRGFLTCLHAGPSSMDLLSDPLPPPSHLSLQTG